MTDGPLYPPISTEALELLGTIRASGGPDEFFPIMRRALISIIDELLAFRRHRIANVDQLERIRLWADELERQGAETRANDLRDLLNVIAPPWQISQKDFDDLTEEWNFARAIDLTKNRDATSVVRAGDEMLKLMRADFKNRNG